jgi:hypothetical protein
VKVACLVGRKKNREVMAFGNLHDKRLDGTLRVEISREL